jgi:hypothetical protein
MAQSTAPVRTSSEPERDEREATMTHSFRSRAISIAPSAPRQSGTSGHRLTTVLTGGAAVLALVLATAMPARADKKDDLAKALIAALVIGAIIHETKRDDPRPAPTPAPVRQPRVPSVCAIQIDGAQRSVTVYPESCLREEGFTYRLPRNCANEARIYGKKDRIYSVQCLRDAGFRVSGR